MRLESFSAPVLSTSSRPTRPAQSPPSEKVNHTNAMSVSTSGLSWFITLEMTGKGTFDISGMVRIDSSIREWCTNSAVGVTAMLFHFHRV
jgi:hypothetical protein